MFALWYLSLALDELKNYFGRLWNTPKNSSLPNKPAIADGDDEIEQKLNDKSVELPTNLDINNANNGEISTPVDKEPKKPIVEPVVPPTNLDKINGNKIQTPSPTEKEPKKPVVEPMKPIVMPTTPPVTPVTPPVSAPVVSPLPTPPVLEAPKSPAVNGHNGKTVPDNKPAESKPKDVETKPKVPEVPPQNEFGVFPNKPKTNVVNTKPKIRDATTDFLAMEQGLPRYLIQSFN